MEGRNGGLQQQVMQQPNANNSSATSDIYVKITGTDIEEEQISQLDEARFSIQNTIFTVLNQIADQLNLRKGFTSHLLLALGLLAVLLFSLSLNNHQSSDFKAVNIQKTTVTTGSQALAAIKDVMYTSQSVLAQQNGNKFSYLDPASRRKTLRLQQSAFNYAYQNYELGRNSNKTNLEGISSRRVSLGAPQAQKQAQKFIFVWEIQVRHNNADTQYCLWLNSITTFTEASLNSSKSLLQVNILQKLVIFTKLMDRNTNTMIRDFFSNQKFTVTQNRAAIDSDYNFLLKKNLAKCEKVVYGSGHYRIGQDKKMKFNLKKELQRSNRKQLYFTSAVIARGNKIILRNLALSQLSDVVMEEINFYLYIFDPALLAHLTPLNFAFFGKYSIEEIIILPLLALLHNSNRLRTDQKILHEVSSVVVGNQKYAVEPPKSQANAICFVSYPSDPSLIDEKQLFSYVESLKSLKVSSVNVSVVIYLPLSPENKHNMYHLVDEISQRLQNNTGRVKIRFRHERALSSFAVYEAVYAYCPEKSLVVSSRHNIRFDPLFAQKVSSRVSEKYHYIFAGLKTETGQTITINESLAQNEDYKQNQGIRRSDLFKDYFMHMQIFKSDLFKTGLFWSLKNQEVDFYETEAPFVIVMLEQIKLQLQYVNQVLATVILRKITPREIHQIKNVQSYVQYDALANNKLIPRPKNCLENQVYARDATVKMPMIIHQIWLNEHPISGLRDKLSETIAKANPESTYRLWKLHDITRQNLPILYSLVSRILQVGKFYQASMLPLAADIARYEIVYQHGGIYVDSKMEGRKSLRNFYKYQVFYLDADMQSLGTGSREALGAGIMGCTQNSYHMKVLIHELIYHEIFQIAVSTPQIAGLAARNSFNEQQFSTLLGLGYHLLLPLPHDNGTNPCAGRFKVFGPEQAVYSVDDIKIGIPCSQYPEAYLINYWPLSGSWLRVQIQGS